MNYKIVLGNLVEVYSRCRGQQYRIVRWPDNEVGERRPAKTPREIDAYAESDSSGEPLAIEHTQIQTFYGQLEDNARFGNFYGELETELKQAFDFHLMLSLPMFAFQKGTQWRASRDAVREWLLANADRLPEKYSSHTVPGVPFEVGIFKDSTGVKLFYVARRAPSDDDVRIESVRVMSDAFRDKNEQLEKYRSDGVRTLLVLESVDIALASHVSIYKAFLQAYDNVATPNIDEFWLARTFDPENVCHVYCLLGPEDIMDCVNPRNFEWGPRYAASWAEAITTDLGRTNAEALQKYTLLRSRKTER
jgi:hypothetical protein